MANPRYNMLPNESDYEYGLRLISIKVEENPDDLDWSDIVDFLHLDCHKDTLRKAAAVTDYSGYRVMKYFQEKIATCGVDENSDYLNELEEKRREIIKERRKLETEKSEYNRWLREEARDDLFEEKVLGAIKDSVGTLPQPEPITYCPNKKSAILNIADCHFGKNFKLYGLNGEVINEFSPEIFYKRMNALLGEVIEYAKREGITNFKVFNLGDSLDGFLRNSQIWTLRYGVVESAILFGEYMGKWLNLLSQHFAIEYHQTCGNHGELRLLDGRKNQHLHENIEIVTGNIIRIMNEGNPNFKYISNKTGFIFAEVAGFNVMGIHGEVPNLVDAIKEYSDVYNIKIDYLICGHNHFSQYKNCGIRRGVIGVGSMMGVDDYAMSLRKAADATSSFVIFEKDKGKTDEHTFVLN